MRKFSLIFIVLLLVVGKGIVYSQYVAEDAQVKLMLKILLYDRNFSRFGDPIKIGVSSKNMLRAMNKQSATLVRGKKFEAELMNSVEDIPKYKVIFVDRNWSKDFEAANAKATENKILMFCGSYNAVENNLAGIAFRILQKKIKIVLNLKVVKDQGSNFPSDFLKLSIVVGNI